MSQSNTESSEVSFWPGYVDAIINVVLNILFLVAVFAMALGVMSTPPKTKDLLPLQPRDGAIPQPDQKKAQDFINYKVTPPTVSPKVEPELSDAVSFKALEDRAQVGFKGADFSMTDDVKKSLSEFIRSADRQREAGAAPSRLLIWGQTDEADAARMRMGYLRLMAIRNELISLGISSERIETRLLSSSSPVGNTAEANFNIAYAK